MVKASEDELQDDLLKYVEAEISRQPLFMFMTESDEYLKKRLQVLCGKAVVPFAEINSEEEAIRSRELYNRETSGLYCLGMQLTRTYDLKLAPDPTVVIYCADSKLDAPTALQMTGRSCRHQGKGRVMLFLLGDPAIKKDAWSRLQATSALRTDDGGRTCGGSSTTP